MHKDNLKSLQRGHTELRQWIVRHVPLGNTLLGYDFFVTLADVAVDRRPVDVAELCARLSHPADQIYAHLAKFDELGLLSKADGQGSEQQRALSPALVELLSAYFSKLEHEFIPRKQLRASQLRIDTSDPARLQFIENLYDQMFDIGWLYLHNFGSTCFMMSTMVQRLAQLNGRRARVEFACLEVHHAKGMFGVGTKGFAGPGQIDGHAICVIDDATVVDFGLGSVRRSYRRNFFWGLACDLSPNQPYLATMPLSDTESGYWKKGWAPPDAAAELARCEGLADHLVAQYVDFFH